MSTTQREVSESGSEAPASGGAIEQAQEKVGAGVEQAKSSAGSLIRSQVDERSSQLGEQLHGAVQALRQAEQTMEQEGTPGSQLVERAAAEVERTARYLSESDGRRVLNDLEGRWPPEPVGRDRGRDRAWLSWRSLLEGIEFAALRGVPQDV